MEKRKRGRQPIDSNIAEYCITAAMNNKGMKRLALFYQVKEELEEMKEKRIIPKDSVIPKKDKMFELFQKAPNPIEEDKPWCVGESFRRKFPPEATDDLLRIWSFCSAAGLEFTIRQAKWACYLRNWSKYRDPDNPCVVRYPPGTLYQWCQDYSNRERICDALNLDLDTSDLDAEVALAPSWEWFTLQITETRRIRLLPESSPDFRISGSKATWGRNAAQIVEHELGIETDELEIDNNTKDDLNAIYAYWLRVLSKGPQWGKITREEKEKIATYLKQDIKDEVLVIECGHDPVFFKPFKALRGAGFPGFENKNVPQEDNTPLWKFHNLIGDKNER